MTDETSWTEKFDRWWAENGARIRSSRGRPLSNNAVAWYRVAFMAGAAAERAESERREDIKGAVAEMVEAHRLMRADYYADDEASPDWGKL